MELIVISEHKLKIMLSGADMAKYELREDVIDCANAHTREAFRHIFEDARAEIGFDTEGERLFIQLYASKEGGCEIFVTKLPREEGERSHPPFSLTAENGEEEGPDAASCGSAENGASLLAVESSRMTRAERELLKRVYACGEEEGMLSAQARTVCIRLNTLRDLTAVCRRLQICGYRWESHAYILDGAQESWFLLLELSGGSGIRLPRRYAFLREYGEEITDSDHLLRLSEYGRLLRGGDAVEVFAGLA